MSVFTFCFVLLWIEVVLAVFIPRDDICHGLPDACPKIKGVHCCVKKVGCDTGLNNSPNNPGPPANLEVFLIDMDEGPRFNITWSAPRNGASLLSLTGFELRITTHECYIVHINKRLNSSVLSDTKDNFFNYTSRIKKYGNIFIKVTSLPIPITEYNQPWSHVRTNFHVTRDRGIHYEINKQSGSECQLRVRVTDTHASGICNAVYLMRYDSSGKRKFAARRSTFNSTQWALFDVSPVPAKFDISTKLVSVNRGECDYMDSKSPKMVSDPFEIGGSASSCYIIDSTNVQTTEAPLVMSQHPLVVSQHDTKAPNQDAATVTTVTVSGGGSNLATFLVPIGVVLCLLILAVLLAILLRRKLQGDMFSRSKTTQNRDTNDKNYNIVKILDVDNSSRTLMVRWTPLPENENVVRYDISVYDSNTNACINKEMCMPTNTETMSTRIVIREDVQNVFIKVATVYCDAERSWVFSDIVSIPTNDTLAPVVSGSMDTGCGSANPSQTRCPVEIEEKAVMVVYSYDFDDHEKSVTEFARLLSSSKCRVLFERWDPESQVDIRRWYEKKLKEADKVIIVHSEGTHAKYEAYVSEQRLEHQACRSLGDTFRLALDLILSLSNETSVEASKFRKKLRHVHFADTAYTTPDYLHPAIINRAAIYRLVWHLNDLLLSIHDLPPSSHNSDYVIPGIDQPAKARLEKAIRQAATYTKQNPSWFSQKCDSGFDSHSVSSVVTTSCGHPDVDYAGLQTSANLTYSDNFKGCNPPRLSIPTHSRSGDIYEGMMTPEAEVSTVLTPGVMPLCSFHPPEFWGSDTDSECSS